MSHAGRPQEDRGVRGAGEAGLPDGAVQLHIMWSWCHGLQARVDDCSLSCNESCPGGVARCSECGPQFPLIAGPARLDCRPLHLTIAEAHRYGLKEYTTGYNDLTS